jgi:hypothetical protein
MCVTGAKLRCLGREGRSVLSSLRRRLDLLIGAGAVLIVAAPLLFTSSGFGLDFTNHLWLSWVEGTELAHAGHPSYFLNAHNIGVFYPWFAFYGGTLYTLTGGISDLLGGQPIAAYIAVTTLAIAASYGGVVSLGRSFGLRGLPAHAPALAVVTSAYYVTNLYGRGAWTEFMAVAAIAPLLASAVHLARARVWRPWPVLVFVTSAVVFSGSHNITLLWGTTVVALALLVIWLALGLPRTLPFGRLTMLAGLGLAGVAVNAWYLIPDITYAKDVAAHLEVAESGALATFFDTPAVLFDPLRAVPTESTTPALFVQVPIWFLAWGLVAGATLMWRRSSAWQLRRAWLSAVVLIAALLAMIMITPFWAHVPYPFNEIQFPYRLGSYLFYAVGALVLTGALALQQASRSGASAQAAAQASAQAGAGTRTVAALRWTLAGVCAVSVALCVWQEWVPNTLFNGLSYSNRADALASVNTLPRSWYDPLSYADVQGPSVSVPSGRQMIIQPGSVHGDRYEGWLEAPSGSAPIQTNIAGGSYLVHVSGVKVVGRGVRGLAVVRREEEGVGPVHVVVEVAHSTTIELSWLISLLGCACVLATFAWTGFRQLRQRRSRATAAAPSSAHA